jgi:hypothetical protein
MWEFQPVARTVRVSRFFSRISHIYTPSCIFHAALFLAEVDAFSPILPVICFIPGWWPVFQAALALRSLIRFSASARFHIAIKTCAAMA